MAYACRRWERRRAREGQSAGEGRGENGNGKGGTSRQGEVEEAKDEHVDIEKHDGDLWLLASAL